MLEACGRTSPLAPAPYAGLGAAVDPSLSYLGSSLVVPGNRADQSGVNSYLRSTEEAIAHNLDAPCIVARHIEVHGRHSNLPRTGAEWQAEAT